MQIALKRVQSLDPAGVGARNVAECLLLQLRRRSRTPTSASSPREIIADHLDRLAQHDVNGLARLLKRAGGRDRGGLRADPPPEPAAGLERRADVDPVHHARRHRAQGARPLDGDAEPGRRAARQAEPGVCLDVPGASRPASTASSPQHLQEARWTVKNVQQRFSTILMVAEAILKRQHHFLEFGPMAMKPLGLREIANELGLHESTVSRVTNNKYMATPVGVFELKYFFSREMATASGGACSATAIRGVIKGMIDAENPTDPLSDAQIARLLGAPGAEGRAPHGHQVPPAAEGGIGRASRRRRSPQRRRAA